MYTDYVCRDNLRQYIENIFCKSLLGVVQTVLFTNVFVDYHIHSTPSSPHLSM